MECILTRDTDTPLAVGLWYGSATQSVANHAEPLAAVRVKYDYVVAITRQGL